MPALVSITGERFGRLVVLARAGVVKCSTAAAWLCRCACGQELVVSGIDLRKGKKTSCKCCARKPRRKVSRTYSTWHGMLQRCSYQKHKDYKYYGARGISVCESWRNFDNFLADMGEAPDGLTLDRVD